MTAARNISRHEEVWLLLPWLANGRLSSPERDGVEAHVRLCSACARELASQRQLCETLTAPERVTYAPAPSFRKLLRHIEAMGLPRSGQGMGTPREVRNAGAGVRAPHRVRATATVTTPTQIDSRFAAWRPPGLAWAASFILMVGTGVTAAVAWHWSRPVYVTHTDAVPSHPYVLHIAFDRALPIGEVEELLRSSGARVIEGPGSSGIFGVTPVIIEAGRAKGPSAAREMRALSSRLHSDPRVRWVEPLSSSSDEQAPAARGN